LKNFYFWRRLDEDGCLRVAAREAAEQKFTPF
jgi:hypothetical protein